jgi:hypothetical protein
VVLRYAPAKFSRGHLPGAHPNDGNNAPRYGATQSCEIAFQTDTRPARTRQKLLDLIVHGFDSKLGRAAVHMLRAVHARFAAQPAVFRYVLLRSSLSR